MSYALSSHSHAKSRTASSFAGIFVACLALFFAAMPVQQAEAKKGRNAALIGGLLAGGLIGGALIGSQRPAYANPNYGQPVYHPQPVYRPQPVYHPQPVYGRPVYGQQYVEVEQDCFQVRERVWDRNRGRYVNVRRTICE